MFFLIALNLLLSADFLIKKDIFFHTDIARDFLLLEDIVDNKHLTLIGPRSGGVSGFFHGPLWLYLNVLAFILGKGNPVVVGWFWFFLYLITLVGFYLIIKKLLGKDQALVGILLLSLILGPAVKGLFNPFGALMLSPFFVYFLTNYLIFFRYRDLLISYLLLGLMVQFQIAFAAPILFLTTLYLLTVLYRKRKLHHLSAILILIIPLSTYIIFEIRHNFLQTNSVFQDLLAKNKPGDQPLLIFIKQRFIGFFVDGVKLQPFNLIFDIPISLYLFYLALKLNTAKNKKIKKFAFLTIYFYLGFWMLTFLFRGVIWPYYYWPFLPLAIAFFLLGKKFVSKKFFYLLVGYVLVLNYYSQLQSQKPYWLSVGKDSSSWQFNLNLAKTIFIDAQNDFGYFIFTPDLFNYSPRYAMNYYQKNFSFDKKSYPFEKKQTTYLIIAPPPDEKPWLNGKWWKENQVGIRKKPVKIFHYDNGYLVEKYILTDEEIKIPADPNLIKDIHFR
jgi:hypothetical protein